MNKVSRDGWVGGAAPLITLPSSVEYGYLIRRYKRFLADVRLDSGDEVTVYCPNPGRMISCAEPGYRVRLTRVANGRRKYPYQWELVHNGTDWIGIAPNLANELVWQAIQKRRLFTETDALGWHREQPFGANGRIDFMYRSPDNDDELAIYVEVKSVTYRQDNTGYFPDAVSARATKQLRALTNQPTGQRVLLYCIQRPDIDDVKPARHIDPQYADAVDQAVASGVMVMTLRVGFDADGLVAIGGLKCQGINV